MLIEVDKDHVDRLVGIGQVTGTADEAETGFQQQILVHHLRHAQVAGPVLTVAGDILGRRAVGVGFQPDLPSRVVIRLVDIGREVRIDQRVDVAVVIDQSQVDRGEFLVEIHAAVEAAERRVVIRFLGDAAADIESRFVPIIAQAEITLIADFRRGRGHGLHQAGVLDIFAGFRIESVRIELLVIANGAIAANQRRGAGWRRVIAAQGVGRGSHGGCPGPGVLDEIEVEFPAILEGEQAVGLNVVHLQGAILRFQTVQQLPGALFVVAVLNGCDIPGSGLGRLQGQSGQGQGRRRQIEQAGRLGAAGRH